MVSVGTKTPKLGDQLTGTNEELSMIKENRGQFSGNRGEAAGGLRVVAGAAYRGPDTPETSAKHRAGSRAPRVAGA
jgi:hypothetical protein